MALDPSKINGSNRSSDLLTQLITANRTNEVEKKSIMSSSVRNIAKQPPLPVPLQLKSMARITPPYDAAPEYQQVQAIQSRQQQKLNEIGKQINSILNQGNKLSRSRKGQIYRPQSEMINMYDLGKNLGPRFKQQSQNDISYNLINSSANLNSINSTNLNIRKKQVVGGVFEFSNEDIKTGTETERSYHNNKIVRDSILEQMKQNQRHEKVALNKTSKDYSMSSGKNQQNIIHEIKQFQKSVNNDDMGSKSENTTSRNNKVVIQNYINERTPTKNIFNLKNFQSPKVPPVQVSNSKVNSLLTSMNKFSRSSDKQIKINTNLNSLLNLIDIPSRILSKGSQSGHDIECWEHLNSDSNKNDYGRAMMVVEDPNNTHRILGLSDFSVRMLNLYSQQMNLVGKHRSPLSAISAVMVNTKQKIFYSGSRDGIIKEWSSSSLQGTYKLIHQFRVTEAPLKLLLDEKCLHIITSGQILRVNNDTHQVVDKVAFQGHLRQAINTPFNEVIVAINNKLYKYSRGDLMLQITIKSEIIQLAYTNLTVYVMSQDEQTYAFKDGLKLRATQVLYSQPQLAELFLDRQVSLITETMGQTQRPFKNL